MRNNRLFPSRGLLRDCKTLRNLRKPLFEALLGRCPQQTADKEHNCNILTSDAARSREARASSSNWVTTSTTLDCR